ncbi:MAG: peptidase MA family metallohydrolase [Syntrophomonadaceae bacterium]
MLGIKFDSARIILLLFLVTIIGIIIYKNSNSLMRFMVSQEINLNTASYNKMETDHFLIKFLPVDQLFIPMIAECAEAAYHSVTDELGGEPGKKTTIVVYPNSQSLAKSFGWNKNEKAMGVYWAGSIRLLSPREWLTGGNNKAQFMAEGPLHHELAHLMVDEITGGNYNRWWTEGIAQYVEKKLTGFQFADPFAQGKEKQYFKLDDLAANFDKYDQQIAYWESLKAIEYISHHFGEEFLFSIMHELGNGCDMVQAIEGSLGIDYYQFEQDFYSELGTN